MAERSKARFCGPSLAGIVGLNPAGGMDVCRECFVLSDREVFGTSRSLVQRSPTDCVVSLCVV